MTRSDTSKHALAFASAAAAWLVLSAVACGHDGDAPVDPNAVATNEAGAPIGDPDGEGGADGAAADAPSGPNVPPEGGAIDGLVLEFERSTPEQIGIHARVEGSLPADARVTVRYWPASAPDWRVGHPLLRIHPEWVAPGAPKMPVDAFAGSIFDLAPGTATIVELTLEQAGKPSQTMWKTIATRALPGPAPAATVSATPASDLKALFGSLKPGDVLELGAGTYELSDLTLSVHGTDASPIYVRGASREGVVLHDAAGPVLKILEASNVVIENLTLEGSNSDSGTSSSSAGVSFWNGGASQEFITLRGLDFRGVDQGIVATGAVRSVLVYDNDMRGNNVWTKDFVESNKTWNDDGIRVPGEGNVAFENTLHGFGDSFAVNDGAFSAAVYFYRNRVTMTGDDSFEADYGTRNLAFYDNTITNASTFLSLDPLWGGPLYCFRNVVLNTVRGPFKLNDTNTGFMIYSNTIVRTEGTTDWGWVQYDNGALRNWSFRDNLLVYRGGTGKLLAIESPGNSPLDFTNNGWYPDGDVWWTHSGGSFGSLAAARAGVPATTPLFGTSAARHEADVVLASDPFASLVTLGSDHLTEVTTDVTLALDGASPAKHAGVAIPNVTDGFTGAAPDLGAVIEGRSSPTIGAHRP
jgi:hypothetical protein